MYLMIERCNTFHTQSSVISQLSLVYCFSLKFNIYVNVLKKETSLFNMEIIHVNLMMFTKCYFLKIMKCDVLHQYDI